MQPTAQGVGDKWEMIKPRRGGREPMTQTPPGLELFLPLYPALKRWAKLGRPSGAGWLDSRLTLPDSLPAET